MAVASLILGIFSIVLSWIPVAGWIICLVMGILAIVLGALGRTRQPEKKGMATAGMILGIIGVVFSVIFVVACGAALGAGAKALKEAGIDLEEVTDAVKDAVESQ